MPTTISGTDGVDNVKVGAVVPADLSTGAPTWNSIGGLFVAGVGADPTIVGIYLPPSWGVQTVNDNTNVYIAGGSTYQKGSVITLFGASNSGAIAFATGTGTTAGSNVDRLIINGSGTIDARNNPIYNSPTTCKAWVNFNGFETLINNVINSGGNYGNISVTQGSDQGTWAVTGASTSYIGQVYYIRSIAGVANATLGGRNVSNNGSGVFNQYTGIQLTSQTTNSYGFKLIEGPALSSQTISTYTLWVTGIRSAYNVSSVTRNGTGSYAVNLATPMSDSFYTVSGLAGGLGGSKTALYASTANFINSTSLFGLEVSTSGGSTALADVPTVTAQVFGN